jgi:hypothetical protein
MIANLGLVVRPFIALAFVVVGLVLLHRSPSRLGALFFMLGAALFLGAELYGVFTLRPYIGRDFDERWLEQISAVDAFATLGLLLCASGLLAHVRKLPG